MQHLYSLEFKNLNTELKRVNDKGKPFERWGRKAIGPEMAASFRNSAFFAPKNGFIHKINKGIKLLLFNINDYYLGVGI